jgi:ribosomal protein S18 acetylase RimI-like enzyme
VSVTVDNREIGPGDDDLVDEAWQLKERIRAEEGVLKQRRGFFADAYRRSTVHAVVQTGVGDDELAGFAAVRRDGYMLFLAVAPEHRGRGYGEALVARAAEDHPAMTCHARTTNENALRFYEHLGFDVKRRIDNYYEDGGDAYYLQLGDDGGFTKRISDFIR